MAFSLLWDAQVFVVMLEEVAPDFLRARLDQIAGVIGGKLTALKAGGCASFSIDLCAQTLTRLLEDLHQGSTTEEIRSSGAAMLAAFEQVKDEFP